MNTTIPMIDKILSSIDSDDVQILASSVETNLSKVKIDKLKKMLNVLLLKKKLNTDEANTVKQFLCFLV